MPVGGECAGEHRADLASAAGNDDSHCANARGHVTRGQRQTLRGSVALADERLELYQWLAAAIERFIRSCMRAPKRVPRSA